MSADVDFARPVSKEQAPYVETQKPRRTGLKLLAILVFWVGAWALLQGQNTKALGFQDTTELHRKLNEARGPLTVFVPLKGVSLIATEGQVFHDPAADEALFCTLRENLDPEVDLRELDLDVNDPEFAHALADRLHTLYEAWSSAPREVRA